jgi:hypothetical protein
MSPFSRKKVYGGEVGYEAFHAAFAFLERQEQESYNEK